MLKLVVHEVTTRFKKLKCVINDHCGDLHHLAFISKISAQCSRDQFPQPTSNEWSHVGALSLPTASQ